MNVLNKTKTYLIGPMQYTSDGQSWRDDMTDFLTDREITVFDPYKKPFLNAPKEGPETHEWLLERIDCGEYHIVEEHMKKVRAFDLSMVDRCDFIVCYYDPNVPTVGTIEELSWAVRMKRPIFMVIEGGKEKTPFWMFGMFPHRYIYSSFVELKEMLARIDDGKTVIDSDRWRLFKQELR